MDRAANPAPFDDDLVFVERYLAGDADAFNTLYQRYYDRVYQIAAGVLLRPDDAADAVQEIFSLVLRHLPRFDRRARFSTWLYRVAVNRSIQQARSLRPRQKEEELQEDLADRRIEPGHSGDPAVASAMAKLNPDDRAVLTLFYWEELSLNEVADSLSCSPNAAKTRLFRARERFRKHYEEASR